MISYDTNFWRVSEMVHTKNWQIIFWRKPKIAKAPKITVINFYPSSGIIEYYCAM